MTELEMLEAEKYWCENCCNWDKEHALPDAQAKCKLTGIICFAQESGKECKCFNVPAENVIVPPCKVGDIVFAKYSATNEIECYVIDKVIHNGSNSFSFEAHLENEDGYVVDILEFDNVYIGITVFLTKEEAEAERRCAVMASQRVKLDYNHLMLQIDNFLTDNSEDNDTLVLVLQWG